METKRLANMENTYNNLIKYIKTKDMLFKPIMQIVMISKETRQTLFV